MTGGRRAGLALASGVTTGSFIWSVSAAFGLGAIMLANAWMFEVIRYFGAGYLMYLAIRSARSAMRSGNLQTSTGHGLRVGAAYGKGLALHLTNPKAILFFGALYAIGMPQGASTRDFLVVILAVGAQSALVFHGYAWMFSNAVLTRGYLKLRRGFETVFALAFAGASLRILTARIQ
jgi:threonine efflux protein